jgi:predicted metal-dependent HD superfamily phosphohydrolase
VFRAKLRLLGYHPINHMTDRGLMKSWTRLCTGAGLVGVAVQAVGTELLARYSEPHRAFHTVEHLAAVVGLVEELGGDDRLVFAAWFHDAVYKPGSRRNEPRSARLARDRLGALGYPQASLQFVADAVLATASHAATRAEFDQLLDADLAILGTDADTYAAYSAAIRREFAHVPELLYRRGRGVFLREMLERPVIYRTAAGAARFELAARRNIRAELARLAAGA